MRVNFYDAFKMNNYSFKGDNTQTKNRYTSLINTDRMVDSFVKMAKTDSGSDPVEAEKTIPSTPEQKAFAQNLVERLKQMGLSNIEIDENYIVTATFDGNIGDSTKSPVVGLLAHYDTSADSPNKNVNPQIHDYKGGNIELAGGTVIPEKDLKSYVGHKIITSDGTTLLGADDKAGIAEILEAINVFQEHPELKRPTIKLAFTPDEETGMGVHKFDIKKFGADFAYTVDGELPHQFNFETFNAFNPEITITGKAVHTGLAKEKGLINANLLANEFINELPADMVPEKTEGREGFIHVLKNNGGMGEAKLTLLVRDFDYEEAKKKVAFLEKTAIKIQARHPGCTINVNPREMYRNMRENISELSEIVDFIRDGITKSGLTPEEIAVRGGTDGSHLSLSGLLTPNLGSGANNFHSKTEFISQSDMSKVSEIIVNLMTTIAENSEKIMPKILSRRGHL